MAQRVLFIVAALAATAPASAQEGLSWRSYAEVGGGIKLSGGQLRPLLAMESGIFLGAVELGSYVQMIPLEFGSPDLLQAAALCYGGSLGCTLDTEALAAKPFGRIGLGGTYTAQADEKGSLAASAAAKSFSCFLSLGIELPLGDRWSARIWSAYSLLDKARDLEGRSLSGFSLGASVRAQWSTTLR
jgi:hypothetical protein